MIFSLTLYISAVELAVRNVNDVLQKQDPAKILEVLKEPGGNFPFIYQDAVKYHNALLKEKKSGLPGNVLVRQAILQL